MKKITVYIIAGFAAFLFIKTGCKDLTNVAPNKSIPAVKSVIPAEAPYGGEVTIGGTGFGSELTDQVVLFNETPAQIDALSDTVLQTRVPLDAQSGPVKIVTRGDTLVGPSFTVDTTRSVFLAIDRINPSQGRPGDTVDVVGTGFDENPARNEMFFDQVSASVISATDTVITTEVPLEAQTGPVSVTVIVKQDTAVGPIFTIEKQQSRTLDVYVRTSGEQLDEDGYTLSVSGRDDRSAGLNDEVQYTDIQTGEVQVELSGIAQNCAVDGPNPRNVVFETDNASTIFTVNCSGPGLAITGISPESGPMGTEVTISGTGFSPTASENIVTFNGVRAELNSASETELAAVVPGDATTGPVNVTVGNQTAEGPLFTVEVAGSLEVNISTTGSSLDPDGYLLSLEGSNDRSVKTNDTIIYDKLDVGSYQVELSDIASNCQLSEELPNPRTVDITESSTTFTDFNINCSDPNEPPVASFTAECTNLSCLFDATGSSDSDGSIVSYEWQFGDGTGGAESSVTKNYELPGTYTVQLTVADDDGATDSRSEEITVTLPEITGISPESGPVGTAVTISGSGFSSVRSENSVTFNGIEAALETASETELMAIVPEGATTGPVEVTVDGYTVRGPDFTVQQPKTLEVTIETIGTQIDGDGYTLSVTGRDDRFVKVNDNAQYSEIYDDEVQIELSGIAANCRTGGENPRTVTLNNSDNAGFTAFALDCTYDLRGKIVFATDRHNYGELYKQNGDGSAVERITESTDYYEAEPAISPDGLRILFSNNKGGGKHILVMDSDGSNIEQVTSSGYNTAPTWSPDGSRILLARSGSSDEPSDIYIMNSDGSNLQNITNTATAREFNPDWSPDGTSIVYEEYIDGKYDIYTINPDGTNKMQITDNDVSEYDPEWSPAGDKIAYVVNLPDASRKIHVMNSDGTGVQELTLSNGNERSPSWSPDGSKIVFSKYMDGYTHIYIYSVEFNDILVAPYTTGNDRAPHWNYK
ncbi:IPT/TIG domain-containing protein [Halalkalibaculum sp. DA3122]|uniref:IPT/TIG domain-containing protein n=1 Tax=Halalkalibaculum sp. DA3122 TaxID=3373607 RepID=UPI00375401EE